MSEPNPAMRVALDPTNPGQFFACCGLLELADRLWHGAEGWFDLSRTAFCLRPMDQNVEASAERLIAELSRCRLTNTMTEEQVHRLEELARMKAKEREKTPGLDDEKKALERRWREDPILLHAPFNLRLDWFLDDRAGGDRFKTWAGQQSVIDITAAMKRPITDGHWAGVPPERWLGLPAGDDSLPFNFDSNLSGQASAIDLGFSADPLKSIDPERMRVHTRPLTELGAFIGLQRFRPFAVSGENRYRFWLWPHALPPEVACAAACGMIGLPNSRGYEFRLLYRTKYLKSFLPAIPIRGDA
jgi:CRISPR-associated protein Csb3